MTMRDDLIEAAARALAKWQEGDDRLSIMYTHRAAAALDAILERLKEPSEEMVEAVSHWKDQILSFHHVMSEVAAIRAMLATLEAK